MIFFLTANFLIGFFEAYEKMINEKGERENLTI